MKKLILLLTIIAGVAIGYVSARETTPADAGQTYVYICTGPKSVAYHKVSSCKGLNNCSTSVKKVTLTDAKKMGRRPCKVCNK